MSVDSWSEARSLADLGVLMARWLEGGILECPGYGGRPDEETAELVPSLAAINRNGFVTINSQPASRETVDGEVWEQRAWVAGLIADEGLLVRLSLAAWRHGINVIVHDGPGRDFGYAYPATTRDGQPVTWVGMRVACDDVACLFDGCHAAAVSSVVTAWQVTLFDPDLWGGGRLWRVLDAVSGRNVQRVAS